MLLIFAQISLGWLSLLKLAAFGPFPNICTRREFVDVEMRWNVSEKQEPMYPFSAATIIIYFFIIIEEYKIAAGKLFSFGRSSWPRLGHQVLNLLVDFSSPIVRMIVKYWTDIFHYIALCVLCSILIPPGCRSSDIS